MSTLRFSLDRFLSIVYNLMRVKEGMNLIWLTSQVKFILLDTWLLLLGCLSIES